MPRLTHLLVCACLCAALPSTATAQFSVSSGFDYTTGDYGLAEDTRMLAIPVTGTVAFEQWTFRATVPYLRVTGPAFVVRDIGQVGPMRPGSSTESGPGDLVVSASYALWTDAGRPGLDLTAKVKLGTADADKGLGTGETDFYVQGDVYHIFGDFSPFGTLGYRVLGDPAAFKLKDGLFASAGFSYRWSEPTRIGAVLDWRQRTVSGGDPVVELTGFVTHRLNERWRVQLYALTGFTDASPEFGIGGVVGLNF